MRNFLATAALSLAALVTTSAHAAELAAPASVRIAVVGKSDREVRTEIRAAAAKVCGLYDFGCAEEVIADASRQLTAIREASAAPRIHVARERTTAIRVSLVGKTRQQVMQEIRSAAAVVCRAEDNSIEAESCFNRAVGDAASQLRGVRFGADQQVASRS